ncbi:histidine kinase [Cytophagales bacterium LB-30]|uniref:Histidine kinase n=1 Tax=Shiella aurantiaca TaxID=3058365 RepID=A0ABT8F510_9BACT|nr:histidine kinase [Shiella aurantiaca]MDN4165527.1 histidine kinase [Shiella aurantiaca]
MRLWCLSFCLLVFSQAFSQDFVKETLAELQQAQTGEDSLYTYVGLADWYIDMHTDSALYYTEKGLEISKRLRHYKGLSTYTFLLGKIARSEGRAAKAKAYFHQAIDYCAPINYTFGRTMIYSELAYQFRSEGQSDSSYFYFDKAFQDALSDADSISMASALNGMALNLKDAGGYQEALEIFYRIVPYVAENDYTYLSAIWTNISLMQMKLQRQTEAVQAAEQVVHYAKQSKEDDFMARALMNKGMIFKGLNMPDSALVYLNQANTAFQDIDNRNAQAECRIQMAGIYLEKDRLLLAEELLREVAQQEGLTKLLEISRLVTLAELCLKKGKAFYVEGLRLLDEAEQLSRNALQVDRLVTIYGLRAQLLESTQPTQSIMALKRHYQLRDSIRSAESNRYAALLQTQYETEKKNRAIASLTQINQAQEAQLLWQRYGLIAGALVLLFGFGFGYVVYLNTKNRQARKAADLEQRLLRLQMNPHFIFNALGAVQSYMLSANSVKAGIYLAKFAKLMRQVLEASREERIPLEREKSILENYLEIQSLRFPSNFAYTISIEERLLDKGVQVPPMFAQPFIENAIEHGKFYEFPDGHIHIRYTEEAGLLKIEVEDNGLGIQETHSPREHHSLSGTITQERLHLLERKFKQSLSFTIQPLFQESTRQGTRVELNLPMLY